jgi:hypothetical protein
MNYIEKNCTVEHKGRKFESGGAIVTDDYLIAYPSNSEPGVLTDWHGNRIGTYSVIGSRPAVFFGHQSWQGKDYFYMRALLNDGRRYWLRGFGRGMIARGKRIKGD